MPYSSIAGIALSTLSKSIINNFLSSAHISKFTLSNDDKLDQISKWYKSEKLVITLGAGASVAYGLPDWNTLLQKLLLITLQTEGESDNQNASILAKTFTNVFEPNSLIAARYLHNHFKKNQPNSKLAFETAIRENLYNEIKPDFDSDLLKEVRQFCIAPGRSPNLDSIITYNYDDLLESCLSNIDVDIPFCPIYASGMKHKDHELPIYHVHGYLPKQAQLTLKNKVVLSEDGYHQQYNDIYGWSNLTQINKFKDSNCLFIGLSFSDPNLRRILDIAKNERGDDEIHHYCFKKKYDKNSVELKFKEEINEHPNDLSDVNNLTEITNELIELVQKFDENDALSFGVGIIWVESYDEIPRYLRTIRNIA